MSPSTTAKTELDTANPEDGTTEAPDDKGELSELRMDSGMTAWLQVVGSWILFMNTWYVSGTLFIGNQADTILTRTRGLTNSYGVFQTYYIDTLLPSYSPSAIAWIGSIQLFLTMIVGIFAGWLLDAGHLRIILLSGTFLEVFGLMMTSLSTKYWHVLLSQAICTGLGSGLLGLTSVAVIPLYFKKRRMIATGIAATGSSLGKITWPYILMEMKANSYSRYHLSNLVAAPIPQNRVRLGGKSAGIPRAGLLAGLLCGHEIATTPDD